ncbi:unnamed protein product [Didymodactylos carnosus]|uniref:Uncharacterized protein n=2 Tax=Didymodactylos carnosus TaxID=1234261 RepID=A0A8S2EMA9_9BILA|nr:unnamed protein product [Didymodactylos carnosus]CAF4020111.1 unnamed protein product [Didymodactylos carnosus]
MSVSDRLSLAPRTTTSDTVSPETPLATDPPSTTPETVTPETAPATGPPSTTPETVPLGATLQTSPPPTTPETGKNRAPTILDSSCSLHKRSEGGHVSYRLCLVSPGTPRDTDPPSTTPETVSPETPLATATHSRHGEVTSTRC